MSKWPSAKRVGGYWNLGRPRVPPLPQNIVMTDRVSGQEWFLTHTGTAPSLTAELSASLPSQPDTVVYGPYKGPYLNGGLIRLYVASGVLLAEYSLDQAVIYNQRVLTRRALERTFLELSAPDGWAPGDPLTETLVTS